MNQTIIAVKIYQYLKEFPERAFEIKDFCDAERIVAPIFGDADEFTEKTVRTAFDNLSEMETIQKWREAGNRPWKLQYAVPDEPEHEIKEKRSAVIDTISTKQYRDLTIGTNIEDDIRVSEQVSNLRSRWVNYANEMIQLAEPQRLRMDVNMLDHLLQLIEHYNKKVWSKVHLIDENEEAIEKPLTISLIHVLLQDGYFHCWGIFEGEDGLTGDKFFLDMMDHVEVGDELTRSRKYEELTDFYRAIRQIPDYFSLKE